MATHPESDNIMDPQNPKPPFKLTGERIALMLGGTLIGALAIVFSLKLATPIVKRACQTLLEAPDKGDRDVRVVSIEAVVLKPGTISKRITTVGKLRANEFVTLHTEMQGRIKEIAFKEGSTVKKGDILIRFEDDELQAEVAKAEADVEYRQTKFDRITKPELKEFTRRHEFDQERGNLNIAKATLDLAKAKLAKATITAPFEGKIGLINVSVGAFVDTQKELVTIVDFDPMKIDFKIPEVHIHDIGNGQTCEIKLDSFPNQIFQGTVEAIDSRVDPQTHSIAVRATIPNEDGKLQTGLFGSVSVIIGVKNDALIVPESAIGREGDIEYVWVVVNGKSGRKRVLTGTKENGQVEITAGLREGDIVVTSGQLKLGEGTAVKISNMGGADVEVSEEDDNDKKPKAAPFSKDNAEPKPEAAKTTETPTPKNETPAPKVETPTAEGAKPSETPTTKDEIKQKEQPPSVESSENSNQNTQTKTNAERTPQPEAVAPTSQTTDAKPDEQATDSTSENKPPIEADKSNDDTAKDATKDSSKEEPQDNSEEKSDERSFFRKALDYVVNLFKRN